MKLLNIIFTYNRESVLKESIKSIFYNTNISVDKTIIIDDNSNISTKKILFDFSQQQVDPRITNIELLLNNNNEGYARNYWKAYNLMKFYNPEYVFFYESDYIFRNNYLEECFELFEKIPDLFVVKGFAHKEYYNRAKIIPWFKDVTIEHFGSPLRSADNLYIEKSIDTKLGNIKYMYGSHACGCIMINWRRIREANKIAGYDIDRYMLKACKDNRFGNVINDGMISCLYAKIWDDYHNIKNDRSDESGVIFVSDFSHATHLNSGGINHDGIINEGYSTVTVNFPNNYNNFSRS